MYEEMGWTPEWLSRKTLQIRIKTSMVGSYLHMGQIGRILLEQLNNRRILPPNVIEQVRLLSHTPPKVPEPQRITHKEISGIQVAARINRHQHILRRRKVRKNVRLYRQSRVRYEDIRVGKPEERSIRKFG
jgi:hypothetical protein